MRKKDVPVAGTTKSEYALQIRFHETNSSPSDNSNLAEKPNIIYTPQLTPLKFRKLIRMEFKKRNWRGYDVIRRELWRDRKLVSVDLRVWGSDGISFTFTSEWTSTLKILQKQFPITFALIMPKPE
jgi:hypothetical protein